MDNKIVINQIDAFINYIIIPDVVKCILLLKALLGLNVAP